MTDIIKSALGLLLNKARDVTASKLSEGDLTDEKFRGVIAREINEIKQKLDGLAKKDLFSSLGFLKEGLTRLGMAVKKKSMNSDAPSASQNVEPITNPAVEELTAVVGASTSQQRLNTSFTISNAVARKLEVVSMDRLLNAKESFKESRKDATRAFSNIALSIDDRIMASKLRIVSRMLESFLEDPDAGGGDCLLYLEELHSLPAVREMYSVYVGGGVKSFFKSFFNQEEREQKVETIQSINTALLDFIAGFTTKIFCHGVHWPTIQLRSKEEYAFYLKEEITKKQAELSEYCRMEARWPDIKIDKESRGKIWYWLPNGPNSRTLSMNRPFIFTDGKTRHLEEFTHTQLVEGYHEMTPFTMSSDVKNALCLTMNNSFWIYVLTYVRKSPKSAVVFSIHEFDSDGKLVKDIRTDLDCCSNSSGIGVFAIHVFNYGFDRKIAVLREQYDCGRVNFVDDFTGQTYRTISLPPQFRDADSYFTPYLSILNGSDIMVTRSDDKALYIYTKEGQLKQIIQLPLEEEFFVLGVAYNAVSEEVLVLTSVSQDSSREEQLLGCRMLVYSISGALQDSYGLSDCLLGSDPLFVNCLTGGVALVGKRFQIEV